MTTMAETKAPAGAAAEACPICGARSWSSLFEARGYPIARCGGCGLVRTLGVRYDGATDYPPFDQRETALVRFLRGAVGQLLKERRAIVRRHQASGRLLDFGCGSGAFARLMAASGYDATGIEPFSLGKPTQEPNLRLVRAPLAEARESLGTFDVVTMWHVFEHLERPVDVLRELLTLLRPGGVLVLSVPNFASWQSRAFEAGWFHLDPPRHVNHFDAATLDGVLGRFPLEIVDRRTFHLEYGPVGWLQSALNKVTPHPNFLFEFVKDRGALAGQPVLETAVNAAISFSAGAMLAAPALAAEVIAGSRGAGSVLTRVARLQAGS